MTRWLFGRQFSRDDSADVRRLLSDLPDPGPAPAHVVDRIAATLSAQEGLPSESAPPAPWDSATRHSPRHPVLVAASAALFVGAAGVAVVAFAVPGALPPVAAQFLPTLPSAAHATPIASTATAQEAAAGASGASSGMSTGIATGASSAARPTQIHLSGQKYQADSLRRQAAQLWSSAKAPLPPLAAESVAIGPIGTAAGISACLDALQLPRPERTVADLATYQGRPATIIVTGSGGKQTVWVTHRQCTGRDDLVAGPLPVP